MNNRRARIEPETCMPLTERAKGEGLRVTYEIGQLDVYLRRRMLRWKILIINGGVVGPVTKNPILVGC